DRFGFDLAPHGELLEWAEIIDSASFASAEQAIALVEPALRIMTWLENNHDGKATERLITLLAAARPLAEIAAEPWIAGPLGPILESHRRSVDVIRDRARLERGVVSFDVSDLDLGAYNKFIPYYLHPGCR